MSKKTLFAEMKKEMPRGRFVYLTLVLPLYALLVLGAAIAAIFLMDTGEQNGVPVLAIFLAFALVCTVIVIAWHFALKAKAKERELARYAYLLNTPQPFEEETLAVGSVEEEGVCYTLSKEGIKAEWALEEGEEQVFDEVQENAFFAAWQDTEFALASQSRWDRVYLALAVIPFDPSGEEEFLPPMILPMDEKLYAAMHAFGLQDKLEADWAYLQYNPQNAFKQILRYGYVKRLYNRDTGKELDEKELFER